MFDQSPNAEFAASTFNLFAIFFISFVAVFLVVLKEYRKDNDWMTALRRAFSPQSLYRMPFGYLLVLSGMIIRTLVALPKYVLVEKQMLDGLILYNGYLAPYLTTLTEFMVYVGFCIIFWPTVQIASYKLLGPGLNKNYYNFIGVSLAVVFKLFLTILGLLVFHALLNIV